MFVECKVPGYLLLHQGLADAVCHTRIHFGFFALWADSWYCHCICWFFFAHELIFHQISIDNEYFVKSLLKVDCFGDLCMHCFVPFLSINGFYHKGFYQLSGCERCENWRKKNQILDFFEGGQGYRCL